MSNPFGADKWSMLFENFFEVFGVGAANTLLFSICGMLLALVLGALFGLLATSDYKFLRAIARIYVETFQNLPLFLLLVFQFNVLPYMGVVLPVFAISVISLGVYHGAYVCEAVRAGIEAVPKEQRESATTLGFSYLSTIRLVILPQALTVMLPMLANQGMFLLRNTSVTALITGGELMYLADSWVGLYGIYGPGYLVVGLMYACMCLPFAFLTRRLENNGSQHHRKSNLLNGIRRG